MVHHSKVNLLSTS